MTLKLHGNELSNVFRLNGVDENSATYALGWVFERSPIYRKLVIEAIFAESLPVNDIEITLQKRDRDAGYTDIELKADPHFHVIFEAKRLRDLPTAEQLMRYHPRLLEGIERRRLVSVSAADQASAQRGLPTDLGGVSVSHLSWDDLRQLAQKALSSATNLEEKLWLRQLIQHLQEFVSMERQFDNKVYVVSLSTEPMVAGQAHRGIDVIEKDQCYFHPVGNNYPAQPQNYVGFRYHGKLQSVHHVDSFDIVRNLADFNPLWPVTTSDHFVYRLGPPMRPAKEMKKGNLYSSGRVWCAIDTLLSGAFTTISDAYRETKRRLGEEL